MSALRLSVRLLSKNINKDFKLSLLASPTITDNKNSQMHTASVTISPAQIFGQTRNYSAFTGKQYAGSIATAMAMSSTGGRRLLSMQEITKNIHLVTDDVRNVEKDPTTLRLKHPVDKPLVVIIAWLMAKPGPLKKYAQIYIDQGFDVLTMTVTPWQLLWPTKGSQLVAADLVRFLENNNRYSPILLHGFSVGGYVWGECMVHMSRDTERYKLILDRICGQIWDSAADITEIPVGVPKALFDNNYTLQKALRQYMIYHLKTFHDVATQHYIRSSQMFHNTLVRSPALFVLSKNDAVGSESSNKSVRDDWERLGVQCTWKCWDKSSHVGHYRRHKDEYLEVLFNHLEMVNIAGHTERLRAKL